MLANTRILSLLPRFLYPIKIRIQWKLLERKSPNRQSAGRRLITVIIRLLQVMERIFKPANRLMKKMKTRKSKRQRNQDQRDWLHLCLRFCRLAKRQRRHLYQLAGLARAKRLLNSVPMKPAG